MIFIMIANQNSTETMKCIQTNGGNKYTKDRVEKVVILKNCKYNITSSCFESILNYVHSCRKVLQFDIDFIINIFWES